jgi:hypothetical protein
MCSTGDERLAQLRRAIEELAADTQAGPVPSGLGGLGPDRDPVLQGLEAPDVTSRLAGIWAMLADLEPGLARRVPGYHTAPGESTAAAEE